MEFNGEAAVLYCFANNMKERMHECKMNIQPLIREAIFALKVVANMSLTCKTIFKCESEH